MLNRQRLVLWGAAAVLLLAIMSPSPPGTVQATARPSTQQPRSCAFLEIADTGPESPYGDLIVGQAINNLGDVAYVAALRTGAAAIYKCPSSSVSTGTCSSDLVTIAGTNEDDITAFSASPYMNDDGVVS